MQYADNTVLIQESDDKWLLFREPVRVLRASSPDDVPRLLADLEDAISHGLHAAGYLAYEAASAFDPACVTHAPGPHPVAWFGLYKEAQHLGGLPAPCDTAGTDEWIPSLNRADYSRAIKKIFDYIHRGDTYQVNYTLRMRTRIHGDPFAYFHALACRQAGHHAAYVQTENFSICSASPELFFERNGDHLVSRPMKGTAPRGRTYEEDLEQARRLQASAKNRAENVMIVDMIRNDLGRVARPGSVKVTKSYEVERYPTVLQMTSTVEARSGSSLTDVLKALFPCASITGAPKVRTMEIIRELEPDPRGVYTGAIGYAAPNGRARFNVAIRTVTVDHDSRQAEYGVGGGIVWDSQDSAEYDECLTKARILNVQQPVFQLLETMLWTPGEGVFLLSGHLDRLEKSRRYFLFGPTRRQPEVLIAQLTGKLPPVPHRLRLLLGRDGSLSLEHTTLTSGQTEKTWQLGTATVRADSRSPFLYHKTTHRTLYEEARASRPECDDVVILNEAGQVTEASIGNIAASLGGRWVTPPVECGLLPGVYRQHLLDQGELVEAVLTPNDLRAAEEVVLLNSVRKRVRCRFMD